MHTDFLDGEDNLILAEPSLLGYFLDLCLVAEIQQHFHFLWNILEYSVGRINNICDPVKGLTF